MPTNAINWKYSQPALILDIFSISGTIAVKISRNIYSGMPKCVRKLGMPKCVRKLGMPKCVRKLGMPECVRKLGMLKCMRKLGMLKCVKEKKKCLFK